MASLTKSYDTQKLLGQVYTPRFIVEKILSDIHFDNETILGKTILDPSCGDGRFLMVVAEKIIELSPIQNLKSNLERIYGWDIDSQAIEECIQNLNSLVKDFQIEVNWNVYTTNSLLKITDFTTTKFDFIVGNPPYIRIQHLEIEERKFIQKNYKFCKNGSTDTYIAFYELCDFLLDKNGICALITPNTFLYSETAKIMRLYFANKQNIIQITNYGAIQLFDNATTYSAITIFDKKFKDTFLFESAQNITSFKTKTLNFNDIKHQKIWQLSINNFTHQIGKKLKEVCNIHVGVTTLCDKAYIFDTENIDNEPDFVYANTKLQGKVKIEKNILKPIIKASKLKNSNDAITEFILFPYQKQKDKHKIIEEEQLKTDFPLTYNYLLSVKDELDKRDNGKLNTVAWYAFGRSQGLDTSFGKKILFSPMNNKPNFILVENEEATFYSGYCIKYNGNYNFLLNQLNSEQLAEFIAISSRDFKGGWKAYNKKVLEDFVINEINEEKSETSISNSILTLF